MPMHELLQGDTMPTAPIPPPHLSPQEKGANLPMSWAPASSPVVFEAQL